jgi:putative hydrolase of the HAD superfamily
MKDIENIVFDLGNVILDIDTELSKIEFAKYGLRDFDKLYTLAAQSEIFDRLEVGSIAPKDFYDEFRIITQTNLTNDTIEHCWNALIMDYTPARIEILKKIKHKYRTFILSNTNLIHYNFYTLMLQEKYRIAGLESLVEKAYFSHEIGLKKPGPEIFDYVLANSKLVAANTLFIDDNEWNIKTAVKMGFKTILLKDKTLEELEIFTDL